MPRSVWELENLIRRKAVDLSEAARSTVIAQANGLDSLGRHRANLAIANRQLTLLADELYRATAHKEK